MTGSSGTRMAKAEGGARQQKVGFFLKKKHDNFEAIIPACTSNDRFGSFAQKEDSSFL